MCMYVHVKSPHQDKDEEDKLTCCASLAAAAASPVSTDATLAPSLTGLSCLGSVGVTRAEDV